MKGLPPGYKLIDFDASLTDALASLENRAAQRFRDHGFACLAERPMDREDWLERYWGKDIWVIACESELVGFAVGTDLHELYWLREVSVDPAHGQRGIGTALVHKVIERANLSCHSAIGLSTFRKIPFNEPFYCKLGFISVPLGTRGARDNDAAQEQFWSELDDDIHAASRVLMLKRL